MTASELREELEKRLSGTLADFAPHCAIGGAASEMGRARKTCRFIWRSFCWYAALGVSAELVVIVCSAAGFSNWDFQNCLPVTALNVVPAAIT
jgi:hypothetical protein